jgi:hypothetical protein
MNVYSNLDKIFLHINRYKHGDSAKLLRLDF